MKYLIGLVLSCFLFAGCMSKDELMEHNSKTLSGDGIEIGKLPDGRNVVRYELYNEEDRRSHYIYVVDNTISISTNHVVQTGKNQYTNRVEVFIDGIKYKAVPENAEADSNPSK